MGLEKQLSRGGRKGKNNKKKEKYQNYRSLQAIKNNKPSFLITPVLPLPHSGRAKEKKAFCQVEVYLRRDRQQGQTHGEPGERSQPSCLPSASWYILKYFNFSALSSALSCLISCARDFFGSTLDAVQERVAVTCAKADSYDVNLKGEVKTPPKNKKKRNQTALKDFKEGKEKKKRGMLFGVKSGSVAEVNAKHRCSAREVCTSLLKPNVSFQNGVRREKVNDS